MYRYVQDVYEFVQKLTNMDPSTRIREKIEFVNFRHEIRRKIHLFATF